MGVAKDDVDVKMAIPGAVLRQQTDFDNVRGFDKISGFYWPPGHNVLVEADAEIVMFSPQHEHTRVIDHMRAKVAG